MKRVIAISFGSITASLISVLLSNTSPHAQTTSDDDTSQTQNIQIENTQSSTTEQNALAGKIWDAPNEQFVATSQLINALSKKQYILIGECHGRKAHHD